MTAKRTEPNQALRMANDMEEELAHGAQRYTDEEKTQDSGAHPDAPEPGKESDE